MKVFVKWFIFPYILFLPSLVLAEEIKGEVKSVSLEGRSFKLKELNSQKEVEIWLSIETQFQGLSSLRQLVKGDEIVVSAQKNKSNDRWEADAITISKVVLRNPKSDIEVLNQTPEKTATVASIEEESKNRIKREMRAILEDFDKKIEAIKARARVEISLQEKYDMLTKDLAVKRKKAEENLAALELSTAERWEASKITAEKSLRELNSILENLKHEINIEREAAF